MAVLLLALAMAGGEETGSRSWQLSQINAKIEQLRRQIEDLEEKKRAIQGDPKPPPRSQRRKQPTITGPRNGRYHISPSGKRVYERR